MEENAEIINFYKKYIKPFVAIFILALLVTSTILLYRDNQLKKEISKKCGWDTKKYSCYCEKQYIDHIQKNQYSSKELNLTDLIKRE